MFDLSIDDTYIYFPNRSWLGKIVRIPKAGGSPTELASNLDEPESIVINTTHIYWSSRIGDEMIRRMPLAGGSMEVVASTSEPEDLVLDNNYVYWVNAYGGTVNRISLGGGTVSTLASGQEWPQSPVVDGTNVYWVNNPLQGGTFAVMTVPKTGGNVTTLATLGQSPNSRLALRNGMLYWTDGGQLLEMSTSGGSPSVIATGVYGGVSSVDDTWVYLKKNSSPRRITKVHRSGGYEVTLASSLQCLSKLVVDEDSLYFSGACIGGGIFRLYPK